MIRKPLRTFLPARSRRGSQRGPEPGAAATKDEPVAIQPRDTSYALRADWESEVQTEETVPSRREDTTEKPTQIRVYTNTRAKPTTYAANTDLTKETITNISSLKLLVVPSSHYNPNSLCIFCKKHFDSYPRLYAHLKTHAAEKASRCQMCYNTIVRRWKGAAVADSILANALVQQNSFILCSRCAKSADGALKPLKVRRTRHRTAS